MLHIEPCTFGELADIKKISDDQFGVNYMSENDLRQYLSSEKSQVIAARKDGILVGFSIFILGQFSDILSEIGQMHYNVIKPFEKNNLIHLHKSTAVHSLHFNEGIGSALMMHEFETYRAEVYLSMIWNREIPGRMKDIVAKHGLTHFCEIENYWSNGSTINDYMCPECGNPPCTCTLVIMSKTANAVTS